MGWRAAAEARLPGNKKVVVIVISGLIFVLALSAVLLSMSFGTGSNSPLSTSGSRPVLGGSTPSSTPSSSSSFSSSSSSSLNAVAQSGSAPASHGTTVIATNYNFYSTTYNSYTYWSQTIYADSVSYFPDHVNFTNGGFANATSPAWSFGTGVSGVNLTISQITNSSIELDDLGTPASTAFVYFYFSPSSYSVTQVNSISSSNFIANYANFLSCTAPCVYLNQTASYIEISNPTGVSTKNIVYLNGASSTTTTTTTTTTSSSIATTTTSTASSVTTTSPTTNKFNNLKVIAPLILLLILLVLIDLDDILKVLGISSALRVSSQSVFYWLPVELLIFPLGSLFVYMLFGKMCYEKGMSEQVR